MPPNGILLKTLTVNIVFHMAFAGADPGPVVAGGVNPSRGGANLIYYIFFSIKHHEIKEILACGVNGERPPLDPPLSCW